MSTSGGYMPTTLEYNMTILNQYVKTKQWSGTMVCLDSTTVTIAITIVMAAKWLYKEQIKQCG